MTMRINNFQAIKSFSNTPLTPVGYVGGGGISAFNHGKILSDLNGKIKEILVGCMTNGTQEAFEHFGKEIVRQAFIAADLNRVLSLLQQTEKHVKIHIAYHNGPNFENPSPVNQTLKKLKENQPARINLIPTNTEISTWTQDYILALDNRHLMPISVYNHELKRCEDTTPLLQNLGQNPDLRERYTFIPSFSQYFGTIKGANIISADRYIFVGPQAMTACAFQHIDHKVTVLANGEKVFDPLIKDKESAAILKSLQTFHKTGRLKGFMDELKRKIRKDLLKLAPDKEIIFVSSYDSLPPQYHLDLIFTYLGENKVMVADPGLAEGVIKKFINDGFSFEVSEDTRMLEESCRDQIYKKEDLDGMASWLSKWMGFEVIRIPIMSGMRKGNMVIPYCSYNNVLLERVNGGKRVYLPVYEIPELDFMAAKCFAKQGFEVREISGLNRISTGNGSLRCSTKVIARG